MANWVSLAKGFPPTLNTYAPSTLLQPNETPAAYGLSSTVRGSIMAGTIPTGVAHTPLYPSGAVTLYGDGSTLSGTNKYRKYYNRLWAMGGDISGTNTYLYFGAPYYLSTAYVPQLTGYYDFHSEIKQFIPLGLDSLAVFTTTGTYVLSNCADSRAFFQVSQKYEGMIITNSNQVVDLDGRVFACTADGVFEFSQNGVTELTVPVRGQSQFVSKALTVDKDKKVLVGTSSFAIDVSGEAPIIFDYSTAGFLYTTPSLRDPRGVPFSVEAVRFVFETTDGNSGTTTALIRRDPERGWESSQSVTLDPDAQKSGSHVDYIPNKVQSAHEFSLKLTALSSNIRIKEILVLTDARIERGYTGA